MTTHDDEGLVGLTRYAVAQGLLADTVSLGADHVQWSDEGAVGGTNANLVAERGNAGADTAHGVFSDTTSREQAGFRVVLRVPESAAHALGDAGHVSGAVQVGCCCQYSAVGQQVDLVEGLAEGAVGRQPRPQDPQDGYPRETQAQQHDAREQQHVAVAGDRCVGDSAGAGNVGDGGDPACGPHQNVGSGIVPGEIVTRGGWYDYDAKYRDETSEFVVPAALNQAQEFNNAIGLTGITLTKLDGTAKGGVVLGISDQFQIPVKYIGIGEKLEDLQIFNRTEFVDSLFSQ